MAKERVRFASTHLPPPLVCKRRACRARGNARARAWYAHECARVCVYYLPSICPTVRVLPSIPIGLRSTSPAVLYGYSRGTHVCTSMGTQGVLRRFSMTTQGALKPAQHLAERNDSRIESIPHPVSDLRTRHGDAPLEYRPRRRGRRLRHLILWRGCMLWGACARVGWGMPVGGCVCGPLLTGVLRE